MRNFSIRVLVVAIAFGGMGCEGEDDDSDETPAATGDTHTVPAPYEPYEPNVDPALLSPDITNALFPFPLGATWAYEAVAGNELERVEMSVESDTREVWGADARVVHDSSYVDGELVEDTWDWFAEDPDGNVWYLGEDTAEYEGGVVTSTAGAWEAGVDNALPGVVMLGTPRLGDLYRQEFLAGEAEDYAEIISLDEDVSVPAGDFTGCLKTRDRSVIEPGLDEFKYYCPGIGNVLVLEGDVRVELVEYTGLD